MIDLSIDLILVIIAGFGSGLLVSIGSGTAGIIILPILTLLLNKDIPKSIGTSLSVDCILGFIAGLFFLRKGKINLRSSLILALSGAIGALIGSQFTSQVPGKWLLLFSGMSFLLFGINFIINGIQKNLKYINEKVKFKFIKEHKTIAFIITGFILGISSGFTGIGGGGFMAIVLVLILGYEVHTAIGTSLIMLSIVAGFGSFGHIINSEFLPNIAIIAGFSAAFGAVIGSNYANRINEEKLGKMIGIVAVCMGSAVIIRMLLI